MRYLMFRNKSMEGKSQVHIFQKLMTVMCLRYRRQAQLITFVFFFSIIQSLCETPHTRTQFWALMILRWSLYRNVRIEPGLFAVNPRVPPTVLGSLVRLFKVRIEVDPGGPLPTACPEVLEESHLRTDPSGVR